MADSPPFDGGTATLEIARFRSFATVFFHALFFCHCSRTRPPRSQLLFGEWVCGTTPPFTLDMPCSLHVGEYPTGVSGPPSFIRGAYQMFVSCRPSPFRCRPFRPLFLGRHRVPQGSLDSVSPRASSPLRSQKSGTPPDAAAPFRRAPASGVFASRPCRDP